MTKKMDKKKIEKDAVFYFENGYHCAEAVAAAVLQAMEENTAHAVAHATAFGGGFARRFDEACGALSGALIVIGHLYPRNGRGEPWDRAAELGDQIIQWFIEIYGVTYCGMLRDRFGEEQSEKCAVLTGKLAAELAVLLQAERSGNPVDL